MTFKVLLKYVTVVYQIFIFDIGYSVESEDFFKILLKCVTIVYHLKKYQEEMESHCLHFAYSEVGHPGTITYRHGLLYYIIFYYFF